MLKLEDCSGEAFRQAYNLLLIGGILNPANREDMPEKEQITIVNVGYRSTNYWVVSAGTSRLIVDLGWPGTMGKMRANLERMDIPLTEIRYALATHWHIDHAGLAQEFKDLGVTLLVPEGQLDAIPEMKQWTKPKDHYLPVTMEDHLVFPCRESRGLLSDIGIPGEIVPTPGHSPDSVSLLLDDGSAFTGDLTHPGMATVLQRETVIQSWQKLKEKGAIRVYPGHGPVRDMHGP